MNIHLESITADNVADLVQPAEFRDTEFYTVPYDIEAAHKVLERAVKIRGEKTGDVLAGYGCDQEERFVGCGAINYVRGEISMGYWVVSALRGQGIGRALRTELDHRALELFPDAQSMAAYIHFRNDRAVTIAESLGYLCTDTTVFGSHMIYRKEL